MFGRLKVEFAINSHMGRIWKNTRVNGSESDIRGWNDLINLVRERISIVLTPWTFLCRP